MPKPRLLIFASGTADGGGSGFENLVEASRTGLLDADIVAVVSNHEHGGVAQLAEKLNVSFGYFPGPYEADQYKKIVADAKAEWIALSGWLKIVHGLDPASTFNMHPALLSFDHGRFGGYGMYGMHIHEAVKKALDSGEITESGFSMHFVTEEMDRGPVFFEQRVQLDIGMSAEDIQKRVQKAEHDWQPKITNMVVQQQIRWDGRDPASLVVPANIQ